MLETKSIFVTDQNIPILQPAKSAFRITTDTLLLRWALPQRKYLCEIGCGIGSISILYAKTNPTCMIESIEPVEEYISLAQKNIKNNYLQSQIQLIKDDISYLERHVKKYDCIFFNPPFHDTSSPSPYALKKIASCLSTSLNQWIDISIKRLQPKGILTFIYKTENLDSILENLYNKKLHVMVWPIYGKPSKNSSRFILWCTKKQQSKFSLLPPLLLHNNTKLMQESHDLLYHGILPETIANAIHSL